MSIIEAIKAYLESYAGLESGAPVWVDYLGQEPVEYGIVPLPGEKILESYINGASQRSFPFAFQSMESTAEDVGRLGNVAFFESLSAWFESQTEAGVLPALDSGKEAEEIEATSWAMLFEQGSSGTGVYQIQCRLVYYQAP